MSARAVIAGLLAMLSALAVAHPVDEVVQSAYLTIAPGELRLQLELTPGTAVVDVLLTALDTDADRHISAVEARAFAQRVLAQSVLLQDDVQAYWRLEQVSVPSYQSLGGDENVIRIQAVTERLEQAAAHRLSYDNRYQPTTSQCIANIFLQPGLGWSYRIAGQQHSADGRGLQVSYSAAFNGAAVNTRPAVNARRVVSARLPTG